MGYGLKFLTGPHTGRILNVSKDMFAIGRDETCQIRIGHNNISRRHCELKFVNGVLLVEDLGSSNGTFLNGVRITEPERLRSGDQLQIGGLKLEVDMLVDNFDHVLDRQRLTPEIAASSTHIYSPAEMVNLSRSTRTPSAPPPEQKTEGFYRLKMLSGEHQGKILRVSKAEFLIGREEACDLRPACDKVSRQHCKILMQGNKLLICDLGTPNGTRVNQKTILSTQPLKLGDQVHVGSFSFSVVELPHASETQAPANEDDIVNWLNEVEDEAEAAATTRIQSTADMKDFYEQLGIEPPKRLQGSAATSARATLDESNRKKPSSVDTVQKLSRHLKLAIDEYRLQNGSISIADIHKALTEVFESIK